MVGATAAESALSRGRALARAPAAVPACVTAGLVAVGALLYHLTRGTTLWFDDWDFVLNRRGSSLGTFLTPHGEHFSLLPVLLYKLLFATAGIGDYRPYRVMAIVGHLAIVALLFVYARRRVGDHLALLAAGLFALFGPGWQNILWPFGIGYQLSLIGGLGLLLALEAESRWADVAACALLGVSLVSSGIGVPILLGAVVEFGLARRAHRPWVLGVPLILYVIWWLAYQHAPLHTHNVYLMPGFAATGIASTFSALAGLAGKVIPGGQGTLIEWGAPLALAGLALGAWRVTRWAAVSPRLAALVATLISFWIIDGLSRASIQPAYSSRYLYVGAALMLLLGVELARGVRPGWPVRAVLTVAVAAAVLSNLDGLRTGAEFLRAEGQVTSSDLAAVGLGRPFEPASYLLHYVPGYPLVQVRLGSYANVVRALGTPAFTLTQLMDANEPAREIADLELISMERVGLVAAHAHPAAHACQPLLPPSVTSPGAAPFTASFALPSGGLLIGNSRAAVSVGVRRFAGQFEPLGSVAPGALALLRPPPDGGAQPWQAQVEATAPAVVCSS